MFKSGYIALIGTPNAGKSTLLNTILGEKLAAVSPKAQTTRKNFLGILTTEKYQMIFLDTPGLHQSPKLINQYMIEELDEAVKEADLCVYLVPVDELFHEEVKLFHEKISKKYPQKKFLLVLNKCDLDFKEHLIDIHQLKSDFPDLHCAPLSALKAEGIQEFLTTVEAMLPEGPAYYPDDQISSSNMRDIVSELIREQAMSLLHQEIPYALAVQITAYKEKESLTKIEADLIVERDSQKGMVVGKGGEMIKKIGSCAREVIEAQIDDKVLLKLRVRLDKNWTKDPKKMARYGYKKVFNNKNPKL